MSLYLITLVEIDYGNDWEPEVDYFYSIPVCASLNDVIPAIEEYVNARPDVLEDVLYFNVYEAEPGNTIKSIGRVYRDDDGVFRYYSNLDGKCRCGEED